ncbi:MAG: TraB/VirB10 family protein [Planctomycetes bacterium]|nr:TraB/VirB10 family protein [Planctomycetota bacterium]
MNKWKWWSAGGIAGGLLLLVVAAGQERRPVGTAEPSGATFEMGMTTAQEVRAMVTSYGRRVEEQERELEGLRTELARMRSAFDEALGSIKSDFPLPPVEPPVEPVPQEAARFRAFDFGPSGKTPKVHLPAGSFAEATLLTGVFAPTNGEPLPVLLRLDAALVGPNRSRLPLPRALLVGKAVGDANSERATIQIETLSIATDSGRALDVRVNGWVADEDGIQGLRGVYVWRAEEAGALAAGAGGLSAAAEALAARQTTTLVTPLGGTASSVTGDPLRMAAFRGLGGAASKISEIVAERLKEIVPAIHVPNGKKVTVAFITGVTLEGLSPDEVKDAPNNDVPYRGLDADR